MCGICGFYGKHPILSKKILEDMNLTLIRRGPDESGIFIDSGVGLAMRRLSIIDLERGRQPIQNEDSSVCVVFNGEIYNFRELRVGLIQKGHYFRTNTDTEVIVHLYEEYGDNLVHYLHGMFAFALWDKHRKRGLLARDRIGIKPLFYAKYSDTLLFGSEIKALISTGLIEREFDYQALDAFFTFTYIPAPLTIYRNIRKLEPGCLLIYQDGYVEKRCYWDVDFAVNDLQSDRQVWLERFDQGIRKAVSSHLVSDVPLGAFLSGGVDSSLVVAFMSQQLDDPVQAFTLGFGGARTPLLDERPLAKLVADRYGCQLYEFEVQPDFRKIVGEIVDAFDEPFADDSVIPSYYISQITRQKVKVALSGLGGDEIFAGYERYSGVWLSQYYSSIIPKSLHNGLIQPLIRRLPEPSHGGDRVNHIKRFMSAVLESPSQRYLNFISTLTAPERRQLFSKTASHHIDFDATDRIITELYEKCKAPDDLGKALYVDIKTYLPEDILALSDRLSMWHSLEIRVPLVDHSLIELSALLPSRYKLEWYRKKILLKQLAARRLPSDILNHRKQGFESPMAAWLRGELSDYAKDILGYDRLGQTGLFNNQYVAFKLQEHLMGRHKNNKLLFSLIMFQEWYERHAA